MSKALPVIKIDNELYDDIEQYIKEVGAVTKQAVYRQLLRDGLKYNAGNDKDIERSFLEMATQNAYETRVLLERIFVMLFNPKDSRYETPKDEALAIYKVAREALSELKNTKKKVITGE